MGDQIQNLVITTSTLKNNLPSLQRIEEQILASLLNSLKENEF